MPGFYTLMARLPVATAVAMLVLPTLITAQPSGSAGSASPRGADRFPQLHWLVGEWQGFGEFADHTAYIHKRYSYELGGMFFVERTLDMLPPDRPSTEYEIHQDFSVIYLDSATDSLRAKGFFVEGFVTSSNVLVDGGGSRILIESQHVENGPSGMRSRVSIERKTEDAYEGLFELAMQGGPYRQIEKLQMRRVH